MSLGKGIAISAIWISCAIGAYVLHNGTPFLAAVIATLFLSD